MSKRDITLVDQGNATVRLTLWGQTAEKFQADNAAVVALKGVRVNDYGGRSLSSGNGTSMSVNPDIPEAHALRGWYDTIGISSDPQAISGNGAGFSGDKRSQELKLISQIKDENLGTSDKVRAAHLCAV